MSYNCQNVCHGFQCTTLLIPYKSLLPIESLWGVPIVSSSTICNPMQELLSHVYFTPVGHLFH
jgi:hypothetical protein